ncbi:CYCD1.2 protein [Gonium pectorale]|uniref:CYCD1.2 protein n=1 Tax=Gonium pectorale TaxID=33097 RepID=A0A150G8Z7_GONPE|nr:CYCD1.2 protein [Gonium pectorale]|eukprot:KXZ46025.1 CYCD1.2 protein [Gonium pectorale]
MEAIRAAVLGRSGSGVSSAGGLKRDLSMLMSEADDCFPASASLASADFESFSRSHSSDCASLLCDEESLDGFNDEFCHGDSCSLPELPADALSAELGRSFDLAKLPNAGTADIVYEISLLRTQQGDIAQHTADCTLEAAEKARKAADKAAYNMMLLPQAAPAAVRAAAAAAVTRAAAAARAAAVTCLSATARAAAVLSPLAPPPAMPEGVRSMLVEWMGQVVGALGLPREILFSAVALMDRFLASGGVEQVHAEEWLAMAVDGPNQQLMYRVQDLRSMETTVLEYVRWRLRVPTAATFIPYYIACAVRERSKARSAAAGTDSPWGSDAAPLPDSAFRAAAEGLRPLAGLAMQLAEITLLCNSFMSYDASTIALACVALAEHLMPPAQPAGAAAGGTVVSAVVSACLAAGLPLQVLAPSVHQCAAALEYCHGQYQQSRLWGRQATGAPGPAAAADAALRR